MQVAAPGPAPVQELELRFANQPLVRALLLEATGRVYENLGLHAQALPLFDRALATRQSLQGEAHPDTLRLLELYPDNFMFSTDYPHSTSLAPGPGGATQEMPADYVADAHKELSPEVRDKACFGNANAIYKLDLTRRAPASERPAR